MATVFLYFVEGKRKNGKPKVTYLEQEVGNLDKAFHVGAGFRYEPGFIGSTYREAGKKPKHKKAIRSLLNEL